MSRVVIAKLLINGLYCSLGGLASQNEYANGHVNLTSAHVYGSTGDRPLSASISQQGD